MFPNIFLEQKNERNLLFLWSVAIPHRNILFQINDILLNLCPFSPVLFDKNC